MQKRAVKHCLLGVAWLSFVNSEQLQLPAQDLDTPGPQTFSHGWESGSSFTDPMAGELTGKSAIIHLLNGHNIKL